MQIADLLGQYNNMSQSAPLKGNAEAKRVVSSLKEMSAGNIFEGTVHSVRNGQVTLALSNGRLITARLDGKVQMMVGQSLFFQVKSNDGMQIAIKPYMVDGNSGNLTLMKALSAAGMSVDEKNLSMVNAMMEEQMSIDRNSLSAMGRIITANPDIDVKTLVQMQKLELPITPQMASQFQNYAQDKQAITKAMSAFIQELPNALVGETLTDAQLQSMGSEILSIVTEGLSENVEIPRELQMKVVLEAPEAADGVAAMELEAATLEAAQQEQLVQNEDIPGPITVPNTLGSILSEEQFFTLEQQLNALIGVDTLTEEELPIKLTQLDSSVSILNAIQERLSSGERVDAKLLKELFSGIPMQELIKDAIEQQWLIRPQNLDKQNKLSKLYERLQNQLDRMENIVKATGQSAENITQLAADIRNNIEFMNQINQMYTYAQIPLKMSGQNASGELFVYTNKKNPAQDKNELTAFLHLDMEHLGSTDVSVKLRGRDVSTKFYFEDAAAFALVQKQLPILEQRLANKGYHCNITVENESKKVDFVEDFLKQDKPTAGMVHRYSFDVKA